VRLLSFLICLRFETKAGLEILIPVFFDPLSFLLSFLFFFFFFFLIPALCFVPLLSLFSSFLCFFFICMLCFYSGTKPKLGLALCFLPLVHCQFPPPPPFFFCSSPVLSFLLCFLHFSFRVHRLFSRFTLFFLFSPIPPPCWLRLPLLL
jgi:hypothetical protein